MNNAIFMTKIMGLGVDLGEEQKKTPKKQIKEKLKRVGMIQQTVLSSGTELESGGWLEQEGRGGKK